MPEGAGGGLHLCLLFFGGRNAWIGHIPKRGHVRDHFAQQVELLAPKLGIIDGDARHVTAGSIETPDETEFDRVPTQREDNRYRRGRRLGCSYSYPGIKCCDHFHLPLHQIDRQIRKLVLAHVGPAVFDGHVLTFNEPGIREALTKRREIRLRARWTKGEDADHRHRWPLLRPRRSRPRRRRTAEEGDEISSLDHSITSSAIASTPGGTSMPSVLAVCKLITNSNLVARITGRSAGFSPLRIRPV